MQPTERIEQVEAARPRAAGGFAVSLAHGAAILLRALAIVALAAPVVIGIVLLLR